MRVAAIIAEYDPFHRGHAALVQAVRRAGATHVAAVMSGCFVQRGAAACLAPGARARQALACGVDLVAELPLPWAVAGAADFARGGVFLADALDAQLLAFGSECGDAAALQEVAGVLEQPALAPLLHERLQGGASFAAAREQAVRALAGERAACLLRRPNDILGVAYCQAIQRQALRIQPFTICRTGAGHDDLAESAQPSAARVRQLLQAGGSWRQALPQGSAAVLEEELAARRAPASLHYATRAVLSRLRAMPAGAYAALPDLSEGLENRLRAAALRAVTLEQLYALVKTRRYSHARVRRLALAAFLGLSKGDAAGMPPYLRVLGVTQAGRALLPRIAAKAKVPLLVRFSDQKGLDNRALRVLQLESVARAQWALCLPSPLPAAAVPQLA